MRNKNNKNRILIIRSNPIAPDPRVEKIARTLVKSGHQVDVFSWARFPGLPQTETRDGYRIIRKEIIADFGTGLANLPNLLKWQKEEFSWLWKHRSDYDIYPACDFDTVLPALVHKILLGKKLVYDIFDFYADHLRKTPRWIKKLIQKIDLSVINSVDGVILVDDARKKQIAGSHPKNLVVVYNSPEDVYSQQLIDHTEQSPSKGLLSIVYIGLLQVERGLFELLGIMEKHPEWVLDLAGFGGDEQAIEQKALELSHVRYYGRIDYTRALELGSKADVFYALYDPENPNHKYASPNKIFEAMMLGKAVLVAHGTNVDEMVNELECGVVVDYNNIDVIEEGLVSLAGNISSRLEMGKNGRKAYETIYSWERMEKRIMNFYSGIEVE
jgi:glycosyltransferase involved in cell wall biosynthesis